METVKKVVRRAFVVPALAIALLASFVTYEVARPEAAKAAAATASSAPLDDNSVGALLAYDRAMEALAARVTPAVVNVAVTSKVKQTSQLDSDDMQQFFGQFFGQRNMPNMQQPRQRQVERGIGSGVIISPDGYIVTNNHVVDDAMDIKVTMTDRKVYNAKLIGTDPLTDLAVIKIEGNNLPNVPWGDSTALHPGQTVLAFGNPFGLRFTVTRGIVSGLNRPNPFSDNARKPGEFIQTDAAINQGNSGGALVTSRGELIGINTFLISPSGAFSGMGFAIPSQIAKNTVDSLIRDGKIDHAYMGVGITDVTPENAKFFKMEKDQGAVISQVEPNSPGGRAGIKVGDVITHVDGKSVVDAGQLQVVISQKKPGTKVNVEVNRDGKQMTLPVTLEAFNDKGQIETASNEPGKPRWGIGLSDLNPDARDQMQIPENVSGAVIAQVQPGSSADDAGLRQGDVIQQVNRKDVKSASDVKQALANVPKGEDALVLVWGNGGSSYRVMHSPGA